MNHLLEKSYDITPIEKIAGHEGLGYFKREDKFTPGGPESGNVNGSKLRQCIHLVHRYTEELGGPGGIVYGGTSVMSPQLPMTAYVAREFGHACVQFIGATKPETCLKYPMVNLANRLGSEWRFAPVAYNPYLKKQLDITSRKDPRSFIMEYGITETRSMERILAFHEVGAAQVKKIPREVTQMVLPWGSTNSALSVIFGLAKNPSLANRIKRIYLARLGPDKTEWFKKRAYILAMASGLDIESVLNKCEVLNVFATHKYHDRVPATLGDVEFHPTYEGKIITLITSGHEMGKYLNPENLFWIVGSEPKFTPLPSKLNTYEYVHI